MNNLSGQLKPRKRFGQNFLQDREIIRKIAQVIYPQKSDKLVEIGPGLGALTLELLPLVDSLDVIEFDRDIIPKLKENAAQYADILHVHQADVLQFDFASLYLNDNKLRIVGNLPYNISSPILFHALKFISIIKDIHIMLQQEVAERIVASPGGKDYGRLSVMVQYHCRGEMLFNISPKAFFPEPKVNSSFIRLTPLEKKAFLAKNFIVFETIVREAFNHRRKTIRNSLKNIISESDLELLGIDSNRRPEELSVDDFVRISNVSGGNNEE